MEIAQDTLQKNKKKKYSIADRLLRIFDSFFINKKTTQKGKKQSTEII